MKSIKELSAAYGDGSSSPVKVAEEALRQAGELNPRLNCFITILEDLARKWASESEERFRSGAPLGPLDGVPIAVKDLIYIEGVRCTAGSKILANHVAAYDAPVVRRLKEAGAVIVGTTNLHEFAAGVTSANPHYGPVRNPWGDQRIPGGSSGGSAAAVSAGIVPGALGTDTAGSVRIPAALCGTVGLKPTYGRVSRLGVVPLSPTFDTAGTLTSCAWDAAALLQTIAGHDKSDPTTVDAAVPDYLSELANPFTGARVGVPRMYFHDVIDQGVEDAFLRFIDVLKSLGCSVVDADLEGAEETYGRWLPVRLAEATAFHLKWLNATPESYGEDVRRSLELGKEVLAVDYVNGVNSRPKLMGRFSKSMDGLDLVAVPTTCIPAPRLQESSVKIGGKDVDVRSALIRLTIPFNVVGFPAVSVPAGLVEGMPVGVQLVARPFEESRAFAVAQAYDEKVGPYPRPPS
ncbi:MAG: Asp-tRNA(Asn)/Glu-tRNA(Gln) amidotransferase subunit GatA [Thaumarchaeota archaeon]|nr:Asp-tRNA(Asn)/Glu-tRNA(Gln) amidotransferase subunit GatA [Nitrososphaerota archaeon]